MSQNVQDSVFSRLTPKQRKAVKALLSGADKDAAAKAAGVTRRTIDRYLNDPAFRVALDKATGTAIGDVARRLLGGMETAVSTMLTLVKNDSTPPTVKLRACIAILEHGPKLFEVHELAQRVQAIEDRLNCVTENPSP